MSKHEKTVYITVELQHNGPWGTPESLAAAVRWDMEENYQTTLPLSQSRVLNVRVEDEL